MPASTSAGADAPTSQDQEAVKQNIKVLIAHSYAFLEAASAADVELWCS